MGFLQDYLFYNEENECPRDYHLWSALTVISAANGRRVYCNRGYNTLHTMLYVTLVGKQGTRKSTAKDIAKDMFTEACPDIPIGAAVQSREDIVKFMSSEHCLRAMNINGEPIEYRPMVFFVNELKNWLSVNPGAMIEFLTDIYDRKYFDASTIKHGMQKILHPCLNILACETPEWIIDKLKSKIISGGFARRMIYVYITDEEQTKRIAFPRPTAEMELARQRCVKHLQKIATISGEFTWSPDGYKFFEDWYNTMGKPEDEVMAGYYRSKHDQLIKVSMCLALAEDDPKLVLTKDLLVLGLSMLDHIEKNMPLLSVAAGRNELALPQQRILEVLRLHDGHMREKLLRQAIDKDLEPNEQYTLLRHLETGLGVIKKITLYRKDIAFEEIWLIDALNSAINTGKIKLENNKMVWKV